MKTAESKLPQSDLPLIRDPELAAAVEAELAPYDGKRLLAAQAAIRKAHASGLEGPYSAHLAAYQSAIREAVAKARAD